MNGETLTLSDGRAIGFQCLGTPGGKALFFFHGTPGSRLALSELDPLARLPGVRLITPERPGYGISDPKPDRVLLDWARDVAEVADHLGVESFAVAGESGGGPHALACAYGLSDRVSLALVLSSPSPANFKGATRGMSIGNRISLFLGRHAPWLVQKMMRGYVSLLEKDPERLLDGITRQVGRADQILLASKTFRESVIRDLREAYRQGSSGQFVDGALAMTSHDWGFDLRQIRVPVHLWHGEDDKLVSKRMAEHLAAEIPGCKAHFVPNAGHFLTDNAVVLEQVRKVLCEGAV